MAFSLPLQAWEAHEAILVDGYLITRQPYVSNVNRCGVRYRKPFSRRFPHFEVRNYHFHNDVIFIQPRK